ncbi:MAG: chromosome segregation protein SMC [Robiginitomaculum sp.]|nr:chromosome segregation protein SMC [Robiginitomaculum sp.]
MGSLRFNHIKLVGFKSFVEPTVFEIEPGLTGVVGPNGCGKSNLLEAIRWVMGANSAKAMRGKAMDDVIFSGTKNRPSRNQASVTLEIDNSARIAPSMFNDNEVLEVTRLITKGSGSKYTVNGQTVRAKDVQLLFADASTGANSPALVRQGQINELISAKPENRRKILEEAAGISGLHTRRHEAELRLRAAETNLDRLEDVLSQIESQLLSLRRQSRQAARFKRLAGEIREYRTLLWLKRWEQALSTLEANEQAFKDSETQVAELTSAVTLLTTEVTEITAKLEPHREEQIIAAAICGRLNAAKEALENDAQAAKSEISKLESRLAFLKGDIEREENIVIDAGNATARLGAELAELQAVKDTSKALDTATKTAEAAIKARSTLENQVSELTRKAAAQAAEHASAQREYDRLSGNKTRLEQDISTAITALEELENANKTAASDNLFAAALDSAASVLMAAKEHEQICLNARDEATKTEREHHEKLSEARTAFSQAEAEHKALSGIVNANQGDQNWTPALESVTAKKGYETALAAALSEDLDAGLEPGLPLCWQGADTPDATLPAGIKPLAECVDAPKLLAARLSQIGVVDADAGAVASKSLLPGQRLVSLQGDVWRWDGFVSSSEVKSTAAVKLENKNRLLEIEDGLDALGKTVGQAEAAWQMARDTRQQADGNARAARQALPGLEADDRAARASLNSFETDQARKAEQQAALGDRLTRRKSELAETITALANAKTVWAATEADSNLENQLADLREDLSKAREAADEASAHYRSLKNETQARAARLNAVEQDLKDWQGRGVHAKERTASLQGREAETALALSAAQDSPDEFTKKQQTLLSELSDAEKRRSDASDALTTIEAALREADGKLRNAERELGLARETRAAAEARHIAAGERKEEIQARIQENLSCAPAELKGQLEDLSPDSKMDEHSIERKLERLSGEREKLGGVNLRADEEAAEQEERLTAMNDERQDLVAAIAKLREGIESLNSEGRQRLLDAFDTVNGHFGRLFTTLFGGGHANLTLSENDDPLEAGLEIMVSPPGKRLGNMSLMSGGEQALTATALIFAVFLSNPAPICVLDEVDAPLDDANVERYCDLLDEMCKSTETKFIAITHNPVTMARMDRLFGVTMAEQGVSQLVSIDLKVAEKLTA